MVEIQRNFNAKSQLTFTFSKSRIKTLECSKLIKIPERRQRRRSRVFYCYFWTYFTLFFSVSIVDFDHVNVSWGLISSFLIFLVNDGESQAVECTQHQVIDSGTTRVWNQVAAVKCDQNLRGWYRMPENSGAEISSRCSTSNVSVSRLSQACGASFRGWMLDRHPSLEDGRVQRRICFSYASECTCEFFTNVYVRNCGKFYVYRLNGVPVCNARYCGNLRNLSSEGELIL